MNPLLAIGLVAVGLAAGVAVGYLVFSRLLQKPGTDEKEAEAALEDARKEAERIKADALEEAQESGRNLRKKVAEEQESLRRELSKQKKELTRTEEQFKKEQKQVESQQAEIQKQSRSITQKEQAAESMAKSAENKMAQAQRHLEQLANMTAEQARAALEEQVIDDARAAAAAEIRKIEDQTQTEAEGRAKNIIVTAIQRHAGEYVSERTVSVVQLPSDEMKGRIIGREGRNIRTLEAATGVDLIIDDTPEAVILSCFNPLRREVARSALTRLIADGRIHPSRIEEIVARCESEVEAQCKEAGEQAVFDLGLHKIHPELVRLLGTLKFRSSYAQNLLRHSVEVGFVAGLMASELGLNVKQARRAGLLHDIGKAADQNVEGSHAQVGAEMVRKYNESPKIAHAIAAHHGEVEPASPLDVLAEAANRLSSQRPGARKEMLESYVRRVETLEKVCTQFEGVRRAFAIQAGREVRVMVENEKISDEAAIMLSKDIASKIETELNYPGNIRVNVIRESRFADFAK